MAKKMLFSFELEPGMIVAEDILDSTGRLILTKGMSLDPDTISKLEFFSISEVPITDEPVEEVADEPVTTPDYADRVKASPEFQSFNSDYEKAVELVKTNLDALAISKTPVNSEALIDTVFSLIGNCKTMIQLFDIMYNLEPTDEPTYHHCLNVAIISVVLGRWIGYKRSDLNQLALAGIIHDVGKLAVPIRLLNKTGKLTDEEFALIKSHVKKGYNIVKNQVLDTRIKDSVIYHHERCDGSGYPFHSKMDQIPDFAKIIAIADVYDAMTSSRTYRQGHCPFEVIKIFDSEGLYKYDAQFIMTFLENIVSSYMHNDVLLSDGRTGEIVMINKNCLYRPVVKCGEEFVDLIKERDLSIKQIL